MKRIYLVVISYQNGNTALIQTVESLVDAVGYAEAYEFLEDESLIEVESRNPVINGDGKIVYSRKNNG